MPGTGFGRMAAGKAISVAPRGVQGMLGRRVLQRRQPADLNILAAMEAAVAGGVDGGDLAAYFKDGMAAGAYISMERGSFVACSAENKEKLRGRPYAPARWPTARRGSPPP